MVDRRKRDLVGWVKIKKAAIYAGVSERTFRSWLKAGLRHSRLDTGTILIKVNFTDKFLESLKVSEDNNLDEVVDSLVYEVLTKTQKVGGKQDD